jgi:hypothetical protein
MWSLGFAAPSFFTPMARGVRHWLLFWKKFLLFCFSFSCQLMQVLDSLFYCTQLVAFSGIHGCDKAENEPLHLVGTVIIGKKNMFSFVFLLPSFVILFNQPVNSHWEVGPAKHSAGLQWSNYERDSPATTEAGRTGLSVTTVSWTSCVIWCLRRTANKWIMYRVLCCHAWGGNNCLHLFS